jgi:hypothetical protein
VSRAKHKPPTKHKTREPSHHYFCRLLVISSSSSSTDPQTVMTMTTMAMRMTTVLQEWRDRLWTFLVNLVANLIADVLEHSRVQQAISKIIVMGMDDTLDQPGFPTKLKRISLLLTMNIEKQQKQQQQQMTSETATTGPPSSVSRQLGEQFPKAAVNFLGGAVAGLRGISSSKKQLKDGNDDETKKDD